MLDHNKWFQKTPNWVWFSFIPVFGGLAISYAGYQGKFSRWLWLGIGFTTVSMILSGSSIYPLIWGSQIITAFYLRKRYLVKTAPRNLLIPDAATAELMAQTRGQVDINTCSKDELVYELGLPIVYANDIELVRDEGYMFTHLEELNDLAGIPESQLRRIAPLVIFCYDVHKESSISWRRLNTMSEPELIALGLDNEFARKIIAERDIKGPYRCLVDIKRRTGIPLSYYTHLLYSG